MGCDKKYFEELGYNFWSKLNGKIFGFSKQKQDICSRFQARKKKFNFPEPIDLDLTMQDFLEDFADTKIFTRERVKICYFREKSKNTILKLMVI